MHHPSHPCALQGNYKDVLNVKESSRQRLQALREATLREEQEYNDILAAEKHQRAYLRHYHNASLAHRSKVEAILDEILSDVARAADNLESRIGEHIFDQSKQVRLGENISCTDCIGGPCGLVV